MAKITRVVDDDDPSKTSLHISGEGVVAPSGDTDLEVLRRQADQPGKRAWAAFVMRKRMIPFEEIAEFLDYESADHARGAVYAVLAATSKGENTETLRQTIVLGLQDHLRQSIEMASAQFVRDPDGQIRVNESRLAWHSEARKDYEVLARISGAQAAAQVQLLSPETEELDALVLKIVRAQGEEPIEVDVLELEAPSGDTEAA